MIKNFKGINRLIISGWLKFTPAASLFINAGTANESKVTLSELAAIDGASAANTTAGKVAILGTGGALAIGGGLSPGAPNAYNFVTGITAFATGGQTSAVALTGEINEVTTVATNGDSVKLLTARAGLRQTVINAGVGVLNVFPVSGGTINGLAQDAAFGIGPGMRATFDGKSATIWAPSTDSSYVTANLVTQTVSTITGVTLNVIRGIVTTVSETAVAGASAAFTVTNNKARITSNIRAWVVDYAGVFTTNGLPIVSVDNRTNGTFDIVVSNAHGANALSGVLQIGFEVAN